MAIVKGVAPGLVLLPAREYQWELKRKFQVSIPIKGKLNDLLSKETLASGIKITVDDEFSVMEENFIFLWQIVGVLFAMQKYPKLEADEAANIVALEKEGSDLVLYGEIIKNVG